MGSIGAKENRGFFSIYFLSRGILVHLKNKLKLLAFIRICLTEKDAVVGKEEMSDTRTAPANGYAYERMIPNRLMNNSRETLGTEEEKARREGISLTKASRWFDGTMGSPIYKD